MGVSRNRGTPRSSMLVGFSLTKTIHCWVPPWLWKPPYMNSFTFLPKFSASLSLRPLHWWASYLGIFGDSPDDTWRACQFLRGAELLSSWDFHGFLTLCWLHGKIQWFSMKPKACHFGICGVLGCDVQAPRPQPNHFQLDLKRYHGHHQVGKWMLFFCFLRRIYNKHVSWTTQYVAGSCIFSPVIPCHTSSGIYECTANRTSSFIWNYYECCCHCEWPLRSLSSFPNSTFY